MTTHGRPMLPSAASAEAVPRAGTIIAGKYRVEREIGKGGMGLVLEAQHITLPQRVAVKVLLPEATLRQDAVGRFLREARAAVSMQGEHIARVFDVGTLETGLPYMVMELLTGADLGAVLRERGPLPVSQALDWMLQACEAIAEAHALGIIHRDVKPANIFLTKRPDGSALVKVLDFGLSKAIHAESLEVSLTMDNVIMGSPFYMSPEQIRSPKGLDGRTDIWAIGVILYQLLTGKRPFQADSMGSLFLMVNADPPDPPRWHRPDLPPALEAAILRCLEKDRAARPQTVAQLAQELAPFCSAEGRISIERIQRLLGSAPPPPRPSVAEDTEDAATIAKASKQVLGGEVSLSDVAATLPRPMPVPADARKVLGIAAAAPEPTTVAGADKTGSMPAIAKDGALGSSTASATAPSRSRALVASVVAVLALGVIGGAALGIRTLKDEQKAPASVAATSEQAPAPPLPVAATGAPEATTTLAATAAAAPPEPAPTAAPAAPSAAPPPSASAIAPVRSAPLKKKKDPLESWH